MVSQPAHLADLGRKHTRGTSRSVSFMGMSKAPVALPSGLRALLLTTVVLYGAGEPGML